MAKKAYIGIGGEECTQVEYIQSSGTQYIDTGFKPNQNTRVVLDIQQTASHSDVPLFGARVAYKNTAFSLWLNSTGLQTDYNNLATTGTFNSATTARMTIDKNKNITTFDGKTITQTAATFQSAYTAYLFGLNQAGSLNSSGTVSIKLYSCQIYDNGTLVRDFVPCKTASGKIGLFDKVNKIFYNNKGTGSFTAGTLGNSLGASKGFARSIKKIYAGILTDIPIYEEQTTTTNITASNISNLFDVANGSTYYFVGSGSTFTTNNGGKNSSTASTVLTAKSDMSVSFDYSYSSEKSYDKFTLKVAGTTIENAVSGATTNKSYSGNLSAGQTIEFTYAKDSSTNSYNDKCTFSNMVVVATKKVLVRVENQSVARKIKKAYVGIGGVARPWWAGGEVVYYGLVNNDAFAVRGSGNNSATLNGLGVFSPEYNQSVYSINGNLTVTKASSDRTHTYNAYPGCAENGQYVLFAGGAITQVGTSEWGDGFCHQVTAYNSALTKTTATSAKGSLSLGNRHVGGRAGNSAIFVGDYYASYINSYNQSLTNSYKKYSDIISISTVYQSAVASIGDKLITILCDTSKNPYAYAFSSSLTATTITTPPFTAMSNHYNKGNGGRVGNYAVFTGCYISEECVAYNQSLTMTTLTPLSDYNTGGVSVNAGENYEYLIYAGDVKSSKQGVSRVYDESLTVSALPNPLSKLREEVLGVNAGKYALFIGGYDRTISFDDQASADVYMYD